MEIPPPAVLRSPLSVPRKLLMGPGPSNSSPRVLQALTQPVVGPMDAELLQVFDEIKEGLQYVFQTRNQLTLALSSSGHGGMEAVLCNLIEPGDKVLIFVNGIWGERAALLAERYDAEVQKVQKSLGDSFSLDEIENAVKDFWPKIVFIVQGESSTGVNQSLEGVGDITRKYNSLLVVDTVASLAAVPFYADKWKVDAVYSGSQKTLSTPPGLAPISFNERAQKVILSRKSKIPVYSFDMILLGKLWQCFGKDEPRIYHHTNPSSLLYALREALAEIVEEGLKNVIERHQKCAQQLYNGIEALGLELYVKDQHKRLPSVTTIHVPNDINSDDVLKYALDHFQLEIRGGIGPTKGKVFRIGIMGFNATPNNIVVTLHALKEGLRFPRFVMDFCRSERDTEYVFMVPVLILKIKLFFQ